MKIDLKNKNVKKAKQVCNECQLDFDNSITFFKHFRSKHKDIVEVSIFLLHISFLIPNIKFYDF